MNYSARDPRRSAILTSTTCHPCGNGNGNGIGNGEAAMTMTTTTATRPLDDGINSQSTAVPLQQGHAQAQAQALLPSQPQVQVEIQEDLFRPDFDTGSSSSSEVVPLRPRQKQAKRMMPDDSAFVDTDDDNDNNDNDVGVGVLRDKKDTDGFLVDTDDDDDDDVDVDTSNNHKNNPTNENKIIIGKLVRKIPSSSSRQQQQQQQPTQVDDDMHNLGDKIQGDAVDVHDDVEFIDEIEWAPAASDESKSNSNVNGELAPKPKPDPMGDVCGCTPPVDTDMTNPRHRRLCCVDPSCILFACQEECRSNCEAGVFCGNKRIQKREWKQVQVFHAGPKGRGLRLLENVKKGDFLLEYIGRAVRASYLTKLFQRYKQERRLYIMALDTNIYLDARKKGSVARYINHSCEPNCVVERWKVRGIIRAGIFATKDMSVGEELSFDYQWERKKGRAPTKCYCGVPTCRGTLEVPKSLEELEFEKSNEGHWIAGSKTAGREIINRSIRILAQEYQQYFHADVCKYDDNTRKHLVIYRHDWEEVWEDLAKEEWQLLNEDDEGTSGGLDFVIAKKVKTSSSSSSSWQQRGFRSPNSKTGLLDKLGAGDNNTGQQQELKAAKPYLFVQTPIKDAFWAKHLIQRCERNCRVVITPKQFAKPPLPIDTTDPEDVDKFSALDDSMDGTVWKLSITGYNIAKALTILQKNVAYLTKQQKQLESGEAPGRGGGKMNSIMMVGSFNNRGAGSNGAMGMTGGAVGSSSSIKSNDNAQEVVMPRCVVDIFKRRLPMVREKCRSVNISFVHSESKSKQFARLVLEATLLSDMVVARESVWSHLNAACAEVNAPKTASETFYLDLGFLGGELQQSDFRLLLQEEPDRMRQECREDLRKSPFFVSFESTQRCSIWVQSEEDKGRIDATNNIVGEATPDAPRKVYFGCDPKDVTKLWTFVQTRAVELARGVRYLFLGADRVYLPFMMQNGAKFFDYVKRVTGASVMVDQMTGDHLRIDGRHFLAIHTSGVQDVDKSSAEAEQERVSMAVDIICLQIEIYRDHCIRRQAWFFGRRDWSKIVTTDFAGAVKAVASAQTRLQFELKPSTVANSCEEIAEITLALGTSGSTGIGAALIFYRFVAMVSSRDDFDTQLKVREIVLACIFLANKAQKVSKWRRLEDVLKASYQVFYPGASFDGSKEEEKKNLADKVLLAEAEILKLLDYDVFNRGTDWMLAAAVDVAGLSVSLANEALSFISSGPVLSAGSALWLKYGVEYVFAAAAGFLNAELKNLFPALSLIPLKVSHAAEIIVESMKEIPTSKRSSTHPLFEQGKENLRQQLPRIKEICFTCMTSALGQQELPMSSEAEQRFRLIASRDCRRYAIRGVHRSLVKDLILPIVDGTSAESNCNIYIGESAVPESEELVLEGSWRAVAIAEYLLRSSVVNKSNGSLIELPPSVDISPPQALLAQQNRVQAKLKPGLLNMGNIIDGWTGTIQSEVSGATSWGIKTGGKICVTGKLAASSLHEVGLRWWVPPQHGPSPTGSITDMFLIRSDPHDLQGGLQRLAQSFSGESGSFPLLACGSKQSENEMNERYVAVSLQRWPSEKVETREMEKSKASGSKRPVGMGIGFSAAALVSLFFH
jgi:SET domain